MRVLRVVVVAAALAGCGDDDSSAVDARSGETPATIPLPTVPWSGEGEEALLVGELRWDETTGCVFAVSPEAEGEVPLVFPYGYGQLADRHALVNEQDEVVAEEGDTVELTGGSHRLIDGEVVGGVITGVPCPDGEAFLVQHPIEKRPDLPISRTLRIRGTRQNANTDLRQNVEPSRVVSAPE